MAPGAGLCTGCLRTLDEIAGWSGFDTAARRAVWRRIGQRLAAAGADAGTSSEGGSSGGPHGSG